MSDVTTTTPTPEPAAEQTPARHFKALQVVADELERDEHLTIGVLVDGAFVPIAQHALGLVEAMKARWSDLGGVTAESPEGRDVQQLQDRVAKLERAALAAGWQLDESQPPTGTPPSQ